MHLRAVAVVLAVGSLAMTGCTTDVYDGVEASDASIPASVPMEYRSESARLLGEHEGVVYVAAKNADGDPCLILYPDADPEEWVLSCNATGIVNLGGEFVGDATLYAEGVNKSDHITGMLVSDYLVIHSYGSA